jgi:galactofuranosylgalactofuranosylrhamnosyl-N-acetylglucosaminyl-diphospho-decaprenol beta-1,5/1,6-galactofuranosyltransferase
MLPLTVIICTYKREEAVAKTLALLFGPEVASTRSVDLRVILVDQGRTLQRHDFPQDWNLRVIHQENYGGAGGFTRGMIEAMDAGAGWMLLMDDDATPDPASFPILADYIRGRAPDDRFALHGAMFSKERPDTVHEAGATIKEPRNRSFDIVQRLQGYKPTTPLTGDAELWRDLDIDYGAWWCFAIHSETVREAGLPLPLFIRGDDCEYGLRLKNRNIATIPLPGLRIWHPQHSGRLDRWYFLFDLRNKLIIQALHLPSSPAGLTLTFVRRVFYRLLGAEYDLAELMLGGAEEFLAGPDALSEAPETVLAKARELARRHVEFIPSNSHIGPRLHKVAKHRALRRIIQTLLINGLFIPKRRPQGAIAVFEHDQFDWMRVFNRPVFAVLSPCGKQMRIHRRSSRLFLELLARLCRVSCELLFRFRKLRRLWCVRMCEFHSSEAWRKHLSLSGDPKARVPLMPAEASMLA